MFVSGVSAPVDEATKEYLEGSAIDMVTVEGRSEARAKFKFTPFATSEDKAQNKVETKAEAAPARSRRRKPDQTDAAAGEAS